MDKFLRGGSLGRNMTRTLFEGYNDHNEKPCLLDVQGSEGKFFNSDDPSRISLRLQSLNYLKKFSSWKIPQASLSRVLSFRQNRQFSFPNYKSYVRPIQSPTSSEYGSIVSSFSYRASSPPELGSSVSPLTGTDVQSKNFLLRKKHRHRRAKSIGDITVTPV